MWLSARKRFISTWRPISPEFPNLGSPKSFNKLHRLKLDIFIWLNVTYLRAIGNDCNYSTKIINIPHTLVNFMIIYIESRKFAAHTAASLILAGRTVHNLSPRLSGSRIIFMRASRLYSLVPREDWIPIKPRSAQRCLGTFVGSRTWFNCGLLYCPFTKS